MEQPNTIEFSELLEREDDEKWSELTGVSFQEQEFPAQWGEGMEKANSCTFVLNGETYTAVEDPSDGYRSSMRYLLKGGECSNMFPPVLVRVVHQTEDHEGGSWKTKQDILAFVDAFTGKNVLEVGTSNTDDYYPSFVSHFEPKNMVYNVTQR